MLEGHISKAFDGDLAALHLRVLAMGGLVLDQVRAASHAYTEWDDEAAQRVLERSATVNAYDAGISEEQFALIARRQPVASDLRAVLALSKIVAQLERAGTEALKIARVVHKQSGRPGRRVASDARHLSTLAASLLRLALDTLDRLDGSLAAEVIARDAELDAEYADGLRRLLTHAMEDPRHFEGALDAAFVLKSLERIGDNARNLAQLVVTMLPSTEPARPEPGTTTPAAPADER